MSDCSNPHWGKPHCSVLPIFSSQNCLGIGTTTGASPLQRCLAKLEKLVPSLCFKGNNLVSSSSHPWDFLSDWWSSNSLQQFMNLPLPMTCILSFGAGCYGNHWHVPSRSNLDRAGNCDTAGIDSEIPSCSRYGSRNTQQGGRLQGEANTHTHTKETRVALKLTLPAGPEPFPWYVVIFNIKCNSKAVWNAM